MVDVIALILSILLIGTTISGKLPKPLAKVAREVLIFLSIGEILLGLGELVIGLFLQLMKIKNLEWFLSAGLFLVLGIIGAIVWRLLENHLGRHQED